LRSSEGFGKTWIDIANDDGTTKTYRFSPKEIIGDIYVIVENYP
jgi:hypothetical protein